jgi:hypothetical protein
MMVNIIKSSQKWRYCKHTSKFCWINLIPLVWPILQYPHVHIPMILHWSIYEFENVFPLY